MNKNAWVLTVFMILIFVLGFGLGTITTTMRTSKNWVKQDPQAAIGMWTMQVHMLPCEKDKLMFVPDQDGGVAVIFCQAFPVEER